MGSGDCSRRRWGSLRLPRQPPAACAVNSGGDYSMPHPLANHGWGNDYSRSSVCSPFPFVPLLPMSQDCELSVPDARQLRMIAPKAMQIPVEWLCPSEILMEMPVQGWATFEETTLENHVIVIYFILLSTLAPFLGCRLLILTSCLKCQFC